MTEGDGMPKMKIGEQRHLGGCLIAYQGVKGRTFYGRSIRLFGDNKTHPLNARTEEESSALLNEKWSLRDRREIDLGPPTEKEKGSILYTFQEAARLWLEDLEAAHRDEKTIRRYRFDLDLAARYLDPQGRTLSTRSEPRM